MKRASREHLQRAREWREVWQAERQEIDQQRSTTVSTYRRTRQGDSVKRPPSTKPLHAGLDDLVVRLSEAWDEIEQVAARQQRMNQSRAERAASIRNGAQDGAR
jgi:hypothetical protein